MPINSRQKGARGERELAEFLRHYGYADARRGQQFSGGSESADVVGLPEKYHIEVKRVEAGSPYKWMQQATEDIADATCNKVPLVFHRRNGKPWLVIMLASDFMEMLNGNETETGVAEDEGQALGPSTPGD